MKGAGEDLDHYRRLGVARDASARDIRRAYRRLARQHHPDLNPRPGGAARFAALAHAYEILANPAARARYDHALGPDGASAPQATTRGAPGWHQPADHPIARRGTLELSSREAEHLTRSPLSLIDPNGQTLVLPAGIGHGDEITLLYDRRAVLLKVRVRERS